jgi:hypothetical protein
MPTKSSGDWTANEPRGLTRPPASVFTFKQPTDEQTSNLAGLFC